MTINTDQEYILCAAIWYKDLTTAHLNPTNIHKGVVLCGHRHGHIIYQMKALTNKRTVTNAEDGVGEHEQGFLTSKNRFVDREEGAIIFQSYGGIIKYSSDTLYSEDLY